MLMEMYSYLIVVWDTSLCALDMLLVVLLAVVVTKSFGRLSTEVGEVFFHVIIIAYIEFIKGLSKIVGVHSVAQITCDIIGLFPVLGDLFVLIIN
jgi:hypothetical protein